MYLKTNALVLRETAYQDADKLLSLLTSEHGCLTARARGVRSRSSRLKAACQLLTDGEFTLLERQGRYTITEAVMLNPFQKLRDDLEKLSLGSYLAQLGETLSDADYASPALLRLLLCALDALARQDRPQAIVKAAAELRLLCLSGYAPALEGCAVCGAPNPDRFHVGAGALHCTGCKDGMEPGLSLPLTPGALTAMRYICAAPLERLFSFHLGDDSAACLAQTVETYLLTQLERGFSALDFYKSLLIQQPESTYESE